TIITNPDGTFTAIGPSSNTVNSNWLVNANFAGDSSYPATFAIQYYNTLPHTSSLTLSTSPQSVSVNGTYGGSGKLKDAINGAALSAMTISFIATHPITIASTTTSNGNYIFGGQVAPSSAGLYNVMANFAGTSLYASVNSTSQTLSVSSVSATLVLNPITWPAWGTNVVVSGKLTSTASGAGLGGKTITF